MMLEKQAMAEEENWTMIIYQTVTQNFLKMD